MMLQQTTVAAVIPYYERFMKRFPTVNALAASEEDAVLAQWSGLGYYSRARNLRRAARRLVESHGGLFPKDVPTALTLEGVGLYTASAVTSIAYGTRAAVVDGNVKRVLSRLHAIRGLTESRAQELARELLARRAPGPWNEAMMELGATICTPREPRCEACPVAAHCRGHKRATYWSAQPPGRPSIRTSVEMALVERRGDILLIRNSASGLMAGLYELPHAGLPRDPASASSLEVRYRGVLQIDPRVVARVRHTVTHHRIEATVFKASLARPISPGAAAFHTPSDAATLPLGGLTRKVLRQLGRLPV
jgi:A/G-specific adenine glycosylase